MKTTIKLICIAVIVTFISCKKEKSNIHGTPAADNYTSVADFFKKNEVKTKTYTINGITGGSFTTAQGTVVTIPLNAFVTKSNVPVTGDVTIQFKDIYRKSDMLLSDMSTAVVWQGPLLKSGGEFFIAAISDNSVVTLATGKKITVALNAERTGGIDTINQQLPFINATRDTTLWFGGALKTISMNGWFIGTHYDSVRYATNAYIFSLYKLNIPADSGTWCNSDNSSFFSAYPQTRLTIQPNDSVSKYDTQVFLIFKNISSMVHVYNNYANNFPYEYAPQGLECTIVAFGVDKDGALYSSFVPITIGANQTYDFTLSKTTTEKFKTRLKGLD